MTALSAYRIMWMLVMFDLPTTTKQERYRATKFRQLLLDEGFQMSQFSVYMRYCSGKEKVAALTARIRKNLPPKGSVHILSITDRQYENIIRLRSRAQEPDLKNPPQLTLF